MGITCKYAGMLISIHAPRTGSDFEDVPGVKLLVFQSTLPARGATAFVDEACLSDEISIHAPRTGSDYQVLADLPVTIEISIHAPRTGSDCAAACGSSRRKISIHAPRTGSDTVLLLAVAVGAKFQSTLPARGATTHLRESRKGVAHFNPRSPHGERQRGTHGTLTPLYFNPRSPHGERPFRREMISAHGCISIHAPRTGSDGS